MKMKKIVIVLILLISCKEHQNEINLSVIDVSKVINHMELDSFDNINQNSITKWFTGSKFQFDADPFAKKIIQVDSIGYIFIIVTDDFEGIFLKNDKMETPFLLSGGFCTGPRESGDSILYCDSRIAYFKNEKHQYEVVTYLNYSMMNDPDKIISKKLSTSFVTLP